MIKKQQKSSIYATYQRYFLKQLLKEPIESTKENRNIGKTLTLLIKLLRLFNYWFNQMEKLLVAIEIFLLASLRQLEYMCKFMATFS